MERFYAWQKNTFAAHGAKGVHIGSHATLYTDLLLSDMRVKTGHVEGWTSNPVRLVREWFRPMYPQIYASLAEDRKERDVRATVKSKSNVGSESRRSYPKVLSLAGLGLFVSLWWMALVRFLLHAIRGT